MPTRSAWTPPEGVTVELTDPTTIIIKGADKQKVGQFAAEIRASPQAGALQGQGHSLRKRTGAPQGRQVLHQRRLSMSPIARLSVGKDFA